MKLIPVLLTFSLVCLVCCLPVMAADAPSLPAAYYGTATYSDGTNLEAGTVILAKIDDTTTEFTVKEDGKIGGPGKFDDKFLVSGKTSGTVVTFYMGNTIAEQNVTFVPGETKEINLVFKVSPKKTSITNQKSPSSDNPSVSSSQQTNVQNSVVPSVSPTQQTNVENSVVPSVSSTPLSVSSERSPESTVYQPLSDEKNADSPSTKSPVPLAGIIIGLGISGIFLTKKRQ